ncbi:hypothetical protein BDR26DRAFT_866432 [Obelidium mucronatum]|nr:hypothetical protein BDR26DRAFT_866432 [Obelidium mucronatum]
MRAERGADANDPGESAEEERRRQDIMNLLGILMMAAGRGGNALGQEPGLQQADGRQPRMVNPLFHLFGGVGDPRDYAFGQGGVDDIVTQLMEQARQSNAPPHLTEEQVAQLPHVTVKGSDLGEHPECAVCQDEFTNEGEGESVVKLSCNHHFHPPCIESWLKLNATCPVCRKAVPTTTAT